MVFSKTHFFAMRDSHYNAGLKKMKSFALAIQAILYFVLPSSYGSDEVRQWTSINGNTIVAAYAGVSNSHVLLHKTESEPIRIQYKNLSAHDKLYVRGVVLASIVNEYQSKKTTQATKMVSFTKNGKTYYGDDARHQMMKHGLKMAKSGITLAESGNVTGGDILYQQGNNLLSAGSTGYVSNDEDGDAQLSTKMVVKLAISKMPDKYSREIQSINYALAQIQTEDALELESLKQRVAEEYIRQSK